MLCLLLKLSLLALVVAVDRSNFKTCQQSSFCRRHRALNPGISHYDLLLNSIVTSDSKFTADIINTKNEVKFTLEIYPLEDSILRIKLNEKTPLHPRFEEPYSLLENLEYGSMKVTDRSTTGLTLGFGDSKAVITSKPFKIDIFKQNELIISLNSEGLLKFEHYRAKESAPEQDDENIGEAPEEEQPANVLVEEDESDTDGLWEETFKSHTDSKPRGPASIGLDISFMGVQHVYGIPEHADSFSLKETGSGDPYRLYNLDVFEYELDNPMALYGSVPVMIGHSAKHTAGIFWHNAAETWIDIKRLPATNVVSSITGFFSRASEKHQMSTHWMSESGIIDLFVMLGNRPMDVFRQYSLLTGTTPLPPLFGISYHQCRWNYNDERDVLQVHDNFDKHNLPVDVIWLDIEHTDGKRYFTWDHLKFPNPVEMTANLTARGRKLVTIVDPHIKRDDNYFFYKENHDLDFYIKTKEGTEFDGWCWPGSSSYIDFTNNAAREHYINTYSLDRYEGSTLDTFTWNDMNEPSVFNGPEVTLQKDCIHPGIAVEHRDMHNVNGLLFHSATYEGHFRRSQGKLRPFVLTRAFYAGSQRTAAIWTGDNTADWNHLRISVPMLLSHSVAGITLIGADVGGFFGNPDEHLLARWYQAAAYTPFYRAHAHIDTKRREPWVFDKETLNIIRESLRSRYRHLPYWYSLFYENELTGAPPMRPLWVEFPSDQTTFDIETEYMLGSGILVRPVVDPGTFTASVYFPEGKWYDIDDFTLYNGPRTVTVDAPRNKIPVYYHGGSIIPRKDRIRRSSKLMRDDPYTLIVALDADQRAQGSLYIDDEHTTEYKKGDFLYLSYEFKENMLRSKIIDPSGKYRTKSWLERVVVIGLSSEPKKVTMNSDGGMRTLQSKYTSQAGKVASQLVIRKPGVNMREEFTIHIH